MASNITLFKEVYGKNPIYFNPYDFSSIVEAMKETLDMKYDDRKKRIQKAQKFIKKYSWTKMAKQTLRVYREALR